MSVLTLPPAMPTPSEVGAGQVLYTIFLPVTDNGGRLFPAELLTHVPAVLATIAGGCTVQAEGRGFWIGPRGRCCWDRITPLLIVASDHPAVRRRLLAVTARLGHLLQQEEIFVTVTPVQIVPPVPLIGAPGAVAKGTRAIDGEER